MSDNNRKAESSSGKRPGRFRRWVRRVWWFLVLYSIVSVALSFIPEQPLEIHMLARENVAFSGALLAGAAKRVTTPPKELWDKMNLYNESGSIVGVADDIYARVVTLGAKDSNHTVSLVAVPLLVIPAPLREAVKEDLTRRGLDQAHFLLSATHTHGGPGNFWDVPFGRFYMGKYQDKYFRFVVTQIADAIEESVKAMRPARIGFGQTQTRHFVQQRRYRDPVTGLYPPEDEELEVIRVDSADGKSVIATVLSVGAHPTVLSHKTDRRISGEHPGAISRMLEEERPGSVGVYLTGAVGSVRAASPRPYDNYRGIKHRKFAKVAMQADMLRQFIREAEAGMTFEDKVDLAAALIKVELPGPEAHYFPEETPYLAVRILTIIPNWIANRLFDVLGLPDDTVFQGIRINHAYLFAFPCDLSTTLGWEIKRHVCRDHVLTLSLANDYSMGYVLSREEYDMGGIQSLGGSERGQCFFGKRSGPFCIKVARRLAKYIREEGASDVFRYRFGDHPGKVPGGIPGWPPEPVEDVYPDD